MKIILLILVGILLPFIAGLSAQALAIGIALFIMAICGWIETHYTNHRGRGWIANATAVCITVFIVLILFYGTWLIGVALLSALWF